MRQKICFARLQLHGASSLAIFILTDKKNTVPSYSFFSNDERGRAAWAPLPNELHQVAIGYFAGIFCLLAFLDHLAVATVLKDQYEYFLLRSQNPFRWLEYSISASFMHLMVAMLSGVFDVHLLFTIFGLTFTTMIFGAEQERGSWRFQGQPEKKSMRPFWFGFFPHAFNWLVVLCFFFQGVSNGDPPAFVWAIIFVIFILDTSFAVNMLLQQREVGKWASYYYGEYVFIVLSLTSKLLLAWLNYGGTNSLSDEN